MSNMAYSLPNHQSQPSPFEQQHLVHQYPSPPHPQGMMYPMQSMGHYTGQNPGGGVPYGIPFAPTYPPYSMPQHPGAGQHGGHFPPFIANPSMQGMGPGQASVYGTGYYHLPFAASYGHGARSSAGQPRQSGPQAGQGTHAQMTNLDLSRRDAERPSAEAEYDVSKTIVDGSNPMKLAPPSVISGKWIS